MRVATGRSGKVYLKGQGKPEKVREFQSESDVATLFRHRSLNIVQNERKSKVKFHFCGVGRGGHDIFGPRASRKVKPALGLFHFCVLFIRFHIVR